MPPGHYPRSVAVAGGTVLAASRVAGPIHMMSRVDMLTRRANAFSSLGVFKNDIDVDTVLVANDNGTAIMGMMPDGHVLLYDTNANAFTVARQNGTSLSGSYAASNYGTFVIGNTVMNSSLVPIAQLGSGSGTGQGITAGFAFVDDLGFRTSSVGASGPGVIEKDDLNLGTGFKPTRMVESPLFTPTAASGGAAATSPLIFTSAFSRTLAPLVNRSTFISLSQSGFTILPFTYDAAVKIPRISKIVNAADQTKPVAPGGLISVVGTDLSLVNLATQEIPVPTALGESCLSVNGIAMPIVMVSSTLINAQLPFNVDGRSQIVLRTPGGASDNLNVTILPNAPSVFRTTSAGGSDPVAAVYRAENNELVSDSNPVRAGDSLVIYATGLGRTSPAVDTGDAAPSEPLASATTQPDVTLSGDPLSVDYAGLTPGGVGVYQINVKVADVPGNGTADLSIRQGNGHTTVTIQVAQ